MSAVGHDAELGHTRMWGDVEEGREQRAVSGKAVRRRKGKKWAARGSVGLRGWPTWAGRKEGRRRIHFLLFQNLFQI